MNVEEHLLACLAEECGEVVQAVAKILRFGLLDQKPGTSTTNACRLYDELCDIETICKMLKEAHVIGGMPNPTTAKEEKVLKYIEYARSQGTVT
jgi:NTP pyrophosphatase (non-canonical NTP hydrolase)